MGTRGQHRWRHYRPWQRRFMYGLLAGLSCLMCYWFSPVMAWPGGAATPPAGQRLAQLTLEQGEQLYAAGQFQEAVRVLKQVAENTSDPTVQILAQRNLALVYRQLGEWQAATTAIAAAQTTLDITPLPNQQQLQAQLLEVLGGVQLDQGQGKTAIATWQQAVELYSQIGQTQASRQAQINQAQAMQQLGFHRQVVAALLPVVDTLAAAGDSFTHAVALRIRGDSLVQIGNLSEAQTTLELAQAIAQRLANPEALSAAALSLGNLKLAQAETAAALVYFDQADTAAAPPEVRVQAQLNRLATLAQTDQVAQVQTGWSSVANTLITLPVNQTTLFAKITLAQTLIALPVTRNPSPRQIADLLATTIRQAQALGDRRSESFATGTLGHLYETLEQWPEAIQLTQSALELAQTINATDISYRWQWQLGRIYKAEAEADQAISAYSSAVDTLKRLRTDLVAVNPAVQVSFQDNVEPIHRELVSLLLAPERATTSEDLETARATIESLQLAELDNFFREACLDTAAVDIDQLDERAAVVYPVILTDRLEIVVSLPNQALRHYASSVTVSELDTVIEQLQRFLVLRVGRQYLSFAQQLYDWMIRPVMADLAMSDVDTLVFVLDGELRSIPMGVLHDGDQFLLEQYNIALTPGLQLINPRPIQSQPLQVVTAGLSEARQGFSALPNVVEEVKQIQSTVTTSAVLLDDGFTLDELESSLALQAAPIVHLASHGKFSSSSDETFVLTWDNRLDIPTLNNLLQTSELNQAGPIELLVLSACQTAAGDKQAALGLAGLAVRSGARSTIATLWQVNDEATAILMAQLYRNLSDRQITKAEALRQAQLTVLRNPKFRQHPFFWAPYVLVGNWL